MEIENNYNFYLVADKFDYSAIYETKNQINHWVKNQKQVTFAIISTIWFYKCIIKMLFI